MAEIEVSQNSFQHSFQEIDQIDIETARVVFQGVDGAYSQKAMFAYFGPQVHYFHVGTFREAMESLRQNQADYAVLPIENSSVGIVREMYDLAVEYDCTIVGDQIIHIDHALMGCKEIEEDQIRTVYSHPQALMQCSEYLNAHPSWQQVSYPNTAMAAQKVWTDQDPTQVAIASDFTAQLYHLKVLRNGITNNIHNATRFLIFSPRKIFLRWATKVSICFEIPHQSGALYHALSHFIFEKLNLTSIESKAIPEHNWEYRFYVVFEGKLNDPAVCKALYGLQRDTIHLRILGNY